MKSVLISIKPKWCDLIARLIKKIEVRKTRPKLDVPFKCYIYCTNAKGGAFFTKGENGNYAPARLGNGKIVGEFVCDRIDNYECELWNDEAYELIRQVDYDEDGDIIYKHGAENNEDCEMLNMSCLTWQDIRKYLGDGINNCYAWHITDLVIYDKPKELSEFQKACESENCGKCKRKITEKLSCIAGLTRTPQSWCYVKELGE